MGASPHAGVNAGAYGSTLPNPDVIVLGPNGGSVSWSGPMAPGARLDGGGGPSGLSFAAGSGSVAVDAVAGTLSEDGRTLLTWTGFDRFYAYRRTSPAPASFTFAGSHRDEQLILSFEDADTGKQRIDLGGGDDTLLLGDRSNVGAHRSSYAGGAGQDHVSMWTGNHLDLDLATGRMVTRRSGTKVRTKLTGFDTQLIGAKNLQLMGTRKADVIRFYACRATVHGRGGADDMAQDRGDDYFEAGLRCNPRKFRLYGDRGNDTLRGSIGRDLLVGGRGRDTIDGNAKRDRCSGERLRNCEVRLR